MPNLFIGTSGWVYNDWEGKFYPEKISSKEKLKHLANHFNTTEINSSFYHLPREKTFQGWYNRTPRGFLFSVKVSRYITHIKRLKSVKRPWKKFFKRALNLKQKLGPVLFQFPPSFKADNKNIKRLRIILEYITEDQNSISSDFKSFRSSIEFRHQSWCQDKIYKILRKYNIGWVISDSSKYPRSDTATSDFVYFRLHGPDKMFASKYTENQLEQLSEKIKKWQKSGKNVYVYFNNDFQAYAIENAISLKKYCK